MTLIGEAAIQCQLRQGLVRIDQGPTGDTQAKLPEVFLRREMKAGQELTLEGAERHLRGAGQLPV